MESELFGGFLLVAREKALEVPSLPERRARTADWTWFDMQPFDLQPVTARQTIVTSNVRNVHYVTGRSRLTKIMLAE
jgi:hypothetical protein